MEDSSHLYELLESLETGALALERGDGGTGGAAVHRLFQSAHNLKSGLAMAGLTKASHFVHSLEDGLDDIRRGRAAWSTAWCDVLLEAVDRTRQCLEDGHDEGLDPNALVLPLPTTATARLDAAESAAALRASSEGERLFRIEKLFLPGLSREEFEGHLIYDDIRDSGTLVSVTPGWDGYSQATGELVVKFVFSSRQTADQLSQLFFDPLMELSPRPEVTRFRLLVLEDDTLTSTLIRTALEAQADVTVAGDGDEGVDLFVRALDEGRPYEVVVCDLAMPGTDGHAALERLREAEEERGILGLDRCLVFMNTANRDYAMVRQSFRLQADAYFIKPLSVEKIQKKLEQNLPWLQNRRRMVP